MIGTTDAPSQRIGFVDQRHASMAADIMKYIDMTVVVASDDKRQAHEVDRRQTTISCNFRGKGQTRRAGTGGT